MISKILLGIFIFSPVFIILLTEKSKIASQIGSILIAYGFGILLGNINLYPHLDQYLINYVSVHTNVSLSDIELLFQKGIITEQDISAFKVYKLQDLLMTLSIPIAIPLLLFSLNIKSWFRMAGKTFLSMILAIISVTIVVGLVGYFYKPHIPNMNKIAGMLTGLYTGGTPNLASLKMMLNVDVDTYIKVHTYDMVPSLLYLLFLISFGRVLFRKFLLPYPVNESASESDTLQYEENSYKGIFVSKIIYRLLAALLVAIVIFAISGLFSLLFKRELQMLFAILSITTLSILASLIPRINRIEKTFELGMYFILVFSVVVASMADVKRLLDISFLLFSAISIVIFGTLLLHTLLCKIFKVDADTLMITSTALMCSPPFVPMIAGALKNKEIIVSGLSVGIIGYAIGNYWGVLMSILLK